MYCKDKKEPPVQELIISRKIIILRGERIMLDIHIAGFYGLETRVLKQAVRRNINRFPNDFMFRLTKNEIASMVSQNVIPSKKHIGGAIPFAFTENGVAMLSSVLNSKRAIEINIAIMRTFTIIRKMIMMRKDAMKEIIQIRKQMKEFDNKFLLIFKYLKQFEEAKQKQLEHANRKRIGFRKEEN